MTTLFDLSTRLLDAAETMTTYLNAHTDELARGEQPHVFTATDAYAQLQQAARELRHGLELAEALEAQGAGRDMTCPIQGLIAMHGLLLEVMPEAYMEISYSDTTKYVAWVCDKPAAITQGANGFGNRVLASGQGDTAAEACDNAIDQLLARHETAAEILADEIPH